jgi:hypothetical protein
MHNEQDYFAMLPNELISMCAGASNNHIYIENFNEKTINDLVSYERNIIPKSEFDNIKKIYERIRNNPLINTFKCALFLTNQRFYKLFIQYKNIVNFEQQFLNVPFNLYDFCVREENYNFIEHWFYRFKTGINCLERDEHRVFGYAIYQKRRIALEENGEKNFLQDNYIRFDQNGKLMVEFKKQYVDFNKFNKNELWKSLRELAARDNLTVDTFIELIEKLSKECHVCNSSSNSKTFLNTSMPCHCFFLIKTLKSIRSLLDNDQSLMLCLVARINQAFHGNNIILKSRPFFIKIQLPVDAKVPLSFCFDIDLL